MRLTRLALLPVLGLLGGCNYIHLGKLPPAALGDPAVAQENSDLRTEKKILQQELALTRREGDALRAVIDSSKTVAGDETLAIRLTRTAYELAHLRESYAGLEAERARLAAASAVTPAELSARFTATEEKLAASLRSLTELREENAGLRAEVQRARSEANLLTAQVRILTVDNDRARTALAQLNTELLAEKDARARATREADAARAQLSTVVAAGRGAAPAALGVACSGSAAGVATLGAPDQPDAATVRLSTSRERLAAAAETAPRTHLVVAGDTLEGLAKLYYGNPGKWRVLYAANNAQLSLGRPLKVGMVIEVPAP
jgi:nucleoid-associated protein YgaU